MTPLMHDLDTIGVGYVDEKEDFKSSLAKCNIEAYAFKHIHSSII